MKNVTLIVRQAEISKEFPNGLQLILVDDASVLDVIKAADEKIKSKCKEFPVKGFVSLLQMVYHPREERFYRQVAIQAYTMSKAFLDIREKPKASIPNGTTIILIPHGGCSSDWEEQAK